MCVSLVLDGFRRFVEFVFTMWRALTLKDWLLFKSPVSYFLNSTFCLVCHVLTQMSHVTPCLPATSCTPCPSASILQNLQMNEMGGGGVRKIG